jgi:hypothetical protein
MSAIWLGVASSSTTVADFPRKEGRWRKGGRKVREDGGRKEGRWGKKGKGGGRKVEAGRWRQEGEGRKVGAGRKNRGSDLRVQNARA